MCVRDGDGAPHRALGLFRSTLSIGGVQWQLPDLGAVLMETQTRPGAWPSHARVSEGGWHRDSTEGLQARGQILTRPRDCGPVTRAGSPPVWALQGSRRRPESVVPCEAAAWTGAGGAPGRRVSQAPVDFLWHFSGLFPQGGWQVAEPRGAVCARSSLPPPQDTRCLRGSVTPVSHLPTWPA